MKVAKAIAIAHPRHPPGQAPRGFSTILVISSMVFLSMAVMAMTALFAHEARRTQTALAQAQLRQLLLAAVPAAQEQLIKGRLPAANPVDVSVPVPVEGASLTLHFANSGVTVEARLRAFKASQTLIFDNGKLTSATLTQTAGQ